MESKQNTTNGCEAFVVPEDNLAESDACCGSGDGNRLVRK